MVVKSVLPNLLNVAQIVNVFTNSSLHPDRPSADTEKTHSFPSLPPYDHYTMHVNGTKEGRRWSEECSLDTISIHSQRIINSLIVDTNYDKHLTPNPEGVTVSIELALQTFYDISETSASFTADVLMSQIWHDRRLRYEHLTGCVENLTLSSAITDKLWQPFVCFVNSKRSDLHQSPSPNTFVLIYPNGTVWVNYRLRIEGPCYVDLQVLIPNSLPVNDNEVNLSALPVQRGRMRAGAGELRLQHS